jgi:hypothetical protein
LKSRFARALALLAALHLIGGHWVVIQSVAWVTMIVDQSQDATLVEAIGKTFDGRNPCPLCKAVATGQDQERERQDDIVETGSKLIAVLSVEAPAAPRSFSEVNYFPRSASERSVDGALLSPPPRAV